jgi:diguanylate cyclase (GGDEF)-like protein
MVMYDERLAVEILKVLNNRYPDSLDLHELKVALPGFPAVADQEWLRVVDALCGDGKLTGKFLRTGVNQLEDAAMLRITPSAQETLQKADSQRQIQLDARLNIPGPGEFDHDLDAFSLTASMKKPLSVIVVDVDHFKNVNDTYGHEVGNEVLRQLAATLVAGCEGKANVYRYGGDEIAILAQNYTLNEGGVLAERLRTEIANLRDASNPPAVTASIGVSTFPEPVSDAKALFKSADEAAYQAKKNGRDQVRTTALSTKLRQVVPLTRRSLSVYMRTDERVRWLDEQIASESGQRFDSVADSSLCVFEKATYLQVSTIDDLAVLVRQFGDTGQKLARCVVPTTPIPSGHSLNYVLDIAAAERPESELRSYFRSLKYTSTAEEYVPELLETLALLR